MKLEGDTFGARRRKSVCCIAWSLALVTSLLFYAIKCVQFENKVRAFERKVQVGMTELDVWLLLGVPSSLNQRMVSGFFEGTNAKEGTFDIFFYKGTWYLRDHLILYFDPKTERLVHKQRGSFAY